MTKGSQIRRKIQYVAKSTYVVSLPKHWVETTIGKDPNEVKHKNLILIPMQDGALAIYPEVNRESATFETSLRVDAEPMKNITFFKKRLISKYLAGYKRIRLTSEHLIRPEMAKTTEELIRLFMGCEIVESTPKVIIIQDRLTPGQLPLVQALKGMGDIAHSATQSSLHALVTQDGPMARQVSKLEEQVEQYQYGITRQLKRVLANPKLGAEQGLNLTEVIEYHSAVQLLARISAHAEEVATEFLTMRAHPDFKELAANAAFEQILSRIKEFKTIITGLSKGAIEVFLEEDEEAAYRMIQTCSPLHPTIHSLKRLGEDLPLEFALNVVAIGDALSRIVEHLRALGELAMNRAEPR